VNATVTEREFQKALTDALSVLCWRWCHFRPAMTRKGWRTAISGAQGFPDVIAVRGERVIFVELKAEKGRLSDAQGQWLAALGLAGQEVHCWRPSDWDVIEETLR
jgi:VRR-NUC domain